MKLRYKPFPFFHLQNIVLREQKEADIPDFFAYYSNPEVHKYILCYIPQNLEEARFELQYWQRIFYDESGAYFAIATTDTNTMIGSVGVHNYNSQHKRIELSYDLCQKYWQQGITSKAIKQVLHYVFSELPVNRVECWVDINNTPSKNLLLKLGFTLEGTIRQHRFHNNKFHNVYYFSFLAQDYANLINNKQL